jgi:hypothetical protein
MIRQAHASMVSAISGATLIAIAIAVFVVLVSAQVFRDWPIAALGDSGNGPAAVSDPRAAHPAHPASSKVVAGSASPAGAGATGKATAKTGRGSAGLVAANGDGSAPPAQPGPVPAEAGPGTSSPASGRNSPSRSAGSASPGSSRRGSAAAAASPSGKVTETVNNTVTKVDETALGGTLHSTGVTEVTEGVVHGLVGPESTVGHVVDETVGTVGGLLPGDH